jgi:hypothetical protein
LPGLFGVPLAWALSRTDMPASALLDERARHLRHPPFLGAVGWILLAGPNAGWLNKAVVALTGADRGPFNIYSASGADRRDRAATASRYVFVFTKSALDLVSSEMEDAANILGAGNLRTTLAGHAAAGAARHPGRLHPGVPGGDRAVRVARAAGASRGRIKVATTQLWRSSSSR